MIPPSCGSHKINFDGSVVNNHDASGFVVRDEFDRPILAGARSLGLSLSMLQNVLLWETLFGRLGPGVSEISESRVTPSLWLIPFLAAVLFLGDIKYLASWFENISWSHIWREVNFVAYAIIYAGFHYSNLHVWDGPIPSSAHKALLFDCMQLSCTGGHSL